MVATCVALPFLLGSDRRGFRLCQRWLDRIVMRAVDVPLAFPFYVLRGEGLAAGLLAVFRRGVGLLELLSVERRRRGRAGW